MTNQHNALFWNTTKKNSCQSRRDGMFLKTTNPIKGAPSGALLNTMKNMSLRKSQIDMSLLRSSIAIVLNCYKDAAPNGAIIEERTFLFAKDVALFCKKLPPALSNTEYSRQLVKASGSVGANYIEANESLGKKDFSMRVKISRKEAKEAAYWLRLIRETNGVGFASEAGSLFNEAVELKKIFSAIVEKSK